jgi:hypothetical protein
MIDSSLPATEAQLYIAIMRVRPVFLSRTGV